MCSKTDRFERRIRAEFFDFGHRSEASATSNWEARSFDGIFPIQRDSWRPRQRTIAAENYDGIFKILGGTNWHGLLERKTYNFSINSRRRSQISVVYFGRRLVGIRKLLLQTFEVKNVDKFFLNFGRHSNNRVEISEENSSRLVLDIGESF